MLTCTIADMKTNNVNTKFAIPDTGYYAEINADAIFGYEYFLYYLNGK